MKANSNIFKKLLCLFLCLTMVVAFSGCSSKKLSEENVISTVNKVESAFVNLKLSTLKKYVRISSLTDSNIKFDPKNIAAKHKVLDLGKAVFENLQIEVVSVNLEEKTVELDVTNKVLYLTTNNYLSNLKKKNSIKQILKNLSDKTFVEENVDNYLDQIKDLPTYNTPKRITVKFEQNKRNLVLVLDEEALNVISGEATIALKKQMLSF